MKISTKLSLSALALVAMSAGTVSAQGIYGVTWAHVDDAGVASPAPTNRVALFIARTAESPVREIRGVNVRVYYNDAQVSATNWVSKPGASVLLISSNLPGAEDTLDSDQNPGTNRYSLGAITYNGSHPLSAIAGALPADWVPGDATPPGVFDIVGIFTFDGIPSPVGFTGNPATASGISDGTLGGAGGASTVPFANINGYANSRDPGVLAVELVDFHAKVTSTGVLVTWETGLEIDNAGFNLYQGNGLNINKLNPILIGAAGTAASYSYMDSRTLTNGETRTYWLEDVDVSGLATTLHGPAVVTGGVSSDSNVPGWDLY